MFFLNEEERMYLNRCLIPESRQMLIEEELRGWNWQQPPLKPVYDFQMAVYEVANNYCTTNRDLYLRRVMGIEQGFNVAMVEGIILHRTLTEFITKCKRQLYDQGVNNLNPELLSANDTMVEEIANIKQFDVDHTDIQGLKNRIRLLWEFEKQRVIYRLQEILSRQPYIGIDALIHQAVPVVVEQKLNGSFLGLSPHLSTDAINFSESIVVDVKFGDKKSFHKLSVTGYALTMEAIHSFPVNIGTVVYPSFSGNRILLARDLFIIDDELRQKFIESRDEKMRMIYQEDDPGQAEDCYKSCPFYGECY